MRRIGDRLRDLFLELDRPRLQTILAEPSEDAQWRARRTDDWMLAAIHWDD